MTNHHEGGSNLLRDVQRFKRLSREGRDEIARLTALITEQRLELISTRVRGSLLRLEDFYTYIGVKAVLHIDGRLDYRKLDVLIGDLLRRRPELSAIPHPNVTPPEYNEGDEMDMVGDLP